MEKDNIKISYDKEEINVKFSFDIALSKGDNAHSGA